MDATRFLSSSEYRYSTSPFSRQLFKLAWIFPGSCFHMRGTPEQTGSFPVSDIPCKSTDMRLGITMIFYLTHAAEYLEMKQKNALQPLPLPLSVSGLAAEGTILLPIQKDPEQVEKERRSTQQKNSLISAARNGDEDAMESLTMDDIDTYAMISQRLTKEDVFSIVDSFFMPSGLECDQYSVMGEITEMNTTKNAVTGERVYELGLVCNDVPIDICINEKDLFGVPEVGRRFKGQIWLQGMLEHL